MIQKFEICTSGYLHNLIYKIYNIELFLAFDKASCIPAINCGIGAIGNSITFLCQNCSISEYASLTHLECFKDPKSCENYSFGNATTKQCQLCQNGEIPNSEKTGCYICQPKIANAAKNACVENASLCEPGTIDINFQCTACPISEYATLDHTKCVSRVNCDIGTFGNNNQCELCQTGQISEPNKSFCIPCQPQLATTNRSTCIANGTLCDPGTIANFTLFECIPCQQTEYALVSHSECVKSPMSCEDGSFGNNQTNQCELCGKDAIPNELRTGCIPKNDTLENKCNNMCNNCNLNLCFECIFGHYWYNFSCYESCPQPLYTNGPNCTHYSCDSLCSSCKGPTSADCVSCSSIAYV
jgi:hypothetical protein